jgi:hypothetical protein
MAATWGHMDACLFPLINLDLQRLSLRCPPWPSVQAYQGFREHVGSWGPQLAVTWAHMGAYLFHLINGLTVALGHQFGPEGAKLVLQNVVVIVIPHHQMCRRPARKALKVRTLTLNQYKVMF